MKRFTSTVILTFLFILLSATQAFAKSSGGGASLSGDSSFEFGLAISNASQDAVNDMIKYANSNTSGGISTSSLTSGYEFSVSYVMRIKSSMFALILRPSYFTQSQTGSGSGGSFDYKLTGYTIFPMLRLIPLENNFIKFFMQTGVGYGKLSADVTEASNSISFSGDNFGGILGLGVDFCFTATSCLTIEGNARYLPIPRNLVSSKTGSFGSLTRSGVGGEIEANSNDLATTLSGIQGMIAYTLNF